VAASPVGSGPVISRRGLGGCEFLGFGQIVRPALRIGFLVPADRGDSRRLPVLVDEPAHGLVCGGTAEFVPADPQDPFPDLIAYSQHK
jgi:hypothetical protein